MLASMGGTINRRTLLIGGAALSISQSFNRTAFAEPSVKIVEISAAPARLSIGGEPRRPTDVWCYGNSVPGPEIRLRQGERARIVMRNNLPVNTTVHWHGIRLHNSMDGVPGITQPPIKPGETFAYEFTPPDAGTFWYHPHADSLQQLGRGMAGVLVVEEPSPQPFDRELVWMVGDWRLTPDAQIATGFGSATEAAMSGRIGNTITVNGVVADEVAVRAGERVRFRIVNGALARIIRLRFDGHRPVVVAIDGQPCDPHEPATGRVLLGPGMRVDLLIDMQGHPGRSYQIVDEFYPGLTYSLAKFFYQDEALPRRLPFGNTQSLPQNPLPEPDLETAERHQLRLQGGVMGGAMMGTGRVRGMSHEASWAINGKSMTGDGHAGMPPLLNLRLGRSYRLAIRNETAWWHPIHLHGFSFRVLSRNGSPVPHRQWADTVLLPPKNSTEIAFVAEREGDWMLHCHVIDHQVSGMMAVLRVA
ncbi:MAG: multicopper oxidase family protein [Pseudomonadota bacterium]